MNDKNNNFEKSNEMFPEEVSDTFNTKISNNNIEQESFEKPGFLKINNNEKQQDIGFFLENDDKTFSLKGDTYKSFESEKEAVFNLDPDSLENNTKSESSSQNSDSRNNYIDKKATKTLGTKGFVALLCIICAIIGGVFGGISAISYERFLKTEPSSKEENTLNEDEILSTPTSNNDETLAGLDNLPTEGQTSPPVSVADSLSASQIYANSVDTVVGISGNMLINNGIWGQSRAQVAGSGFIISQDGYIVTNAHVVNGVDDLSVTLYNKEKYPAELVGMEKSNDIAVIKINSKNLKAATWGDSDSLVVGEELLIIGNPLGELTHTLTNGVVSALSRRIESENDVINMFQTNAAINSGNSGGPVFDMNGKVVGIATSKYASSSLEGLSFCIPSNDVKGYVNDIIKHGYVRNRPLLGVSVQTVTNSIASRYNIVLGAYVVAIGEGSAAAKSGIMPSDVIVELNNEPVSSVADLQGALNNLRAGQNVPISVYRQGQRVDLSIVLDEKLPANARTKYTNVFDL